MNQSLSGIRVLDLSTSASAAWCTRVLADLGADVTMVEGPGGHPLRNEPPFDDAGTSLVAEYFLANKRSILLDSGVPGAVARIREMGRRVDVVVSSARSGDSRRAGLTYAEFASPSLVLAHVTPFGMSGPRADDPGNELTVAALSGWAALNGDAAKEPLRPVGHQVALCTGVLAAAAVIGALIARDRDNGAGQEIDIAELDTMVSAGSPGILRGQYTGRSTPRRNGVDLASGPVPVADGYFALTLSRAHFWRDAMTVLGLDDLAEDPRWETSWYRAAHRDEYEARVARAMAGWSRSDLFDELAARRVVAGPVLTMEELRANPHLAERGFWTEVDGRPFPGAPFRMSATPWQLRRGAPARPAAEGAQ